MADGSGNLFGLADMALRRGVAADAVQLDALERQIFAFEQLPLASFRRYLNLAGADLIVADHCGHCAGYALATYRKGGTIGWLISIGVAPRAAGRGVGQALLRRIEAEAAARGMTLMRLAVRADNVAAIRLYERLDYRRRAVKRAYYADFCDALVYDRPLA